MTSYNFTFVNPLDRPKIANNIVEIIGATPMVRLGRVAREHGVVADIVLKLESMEPCGSVKDRIAKSMIEEAEKRGEIRPGEHVLIEPTSGNTGIGLAMVGAAKGYEVVLVMPFNMSIERRVMLKALGAKVILTPTEDGIRGSLFKCYEIMKQLNGKGYMLQQFSNPDNPRAHVETTGPEIWYQTEGKIDILVGGVGTGGTVSGCAKYIRNFKPTLKVIAVEPEESSVLSGGEPGLHIIQGIGAGFVPNNCDMNQVNEVMKIDGDTAVSFARQIASKEGIFVGISSGAAIAAAIKAGIRLENAGKTIVAVIPSFGERYLSTPLFYDLFLEASSQAAEPVDFSVV